MTQPEEIRVADELVQATADYCIKTNRDPAEGVALLLLAAMKIHVAYASEPRNTPKVLSAIVEDMATIYLKELEETLQ